MRTINIPIFIPHEGCKNSCVFCNQKTITGTNCSANRDINPEIQQVLSTTSSDDDIKIAFFGGSFTGIDKHLMTSLCDTAYEYVKKRLVSSIRISTRPDYIDDDILCILKSRGVTNIELGVQSMSQKVLDACKRGHTIADTINACNLIKKHGFILGGQMMIGLPQSNIQDEIQTAKEIVRLGASEARIYPTVVFKDTQLYNMATSREYSPLSVDEAVMRSVSVYEIFKDAGVKVLRIGLQSSESLSSDDCVYAGANHPSLGELVESEYLYKKIILQSRDITSLLPENFNEYTFRLYIHCNFRDTSKIIGNKGKNTKRILEYFKDYNITDVKVNQNNTYTNGQVSFSIETLKAKD